MIEATELSKSFNGHKAVDAVSIQVDRGQIFGLLGPNAAGKSTVIRMMCGLLDRDSGDVKLDGMDVKQAKASLGYVSQHFGQYEELTVWENLNFYAQMYGVQDDSRLTGLLDRYDLTQFKTLAAGSLSGGYQRRLALTCALAHDPKVLFLDEPTAGIDPVTRKYMWDDLYALSAEGKTLFITTHYMEEAQRCHTLSFLSKGRIVAQGTPDTISQALGAVKVYTTMIPYLPELRQALLAIEGVILVNQFGVELRIVAAPEVASTTLESTINTVMGKPCSLEPSDPNLEDTFIALTQDSASKP